MKMGKDLLDGDGENGSDSGVQRFSGLADRGRLAAEHEYAVQHRFFHGGRYPFAAALSRTSFGAQVLGDHLVGGAFIDVIADFFRPHDLGQQFLNGIVVFHQQDHRILQLHLGVAGDQELVPLAVP